MEVLGRRLEEATAQEQAQAQALKRTWLEKVQRCAGAWDCPPPVCVMMGRQLKDRADAKGLGPTLLISAASLTCAVGVAKCSHSMGLRMSAKSSSLCDMHAHCRYQGAVASLTQELDQARDAWAREKAELQVGSCTAALWSRVVQGCSGGVMQWCLRD